MHRFCISGCISHLHAHTLSLPTSSVFPPHTTGRDHFVVLVGDRGACYMDDSPLLSNIIRVRVGREGKVSFRCLQNMYTKVCLLHGYVC